MQHEIKVLLEAVTHAKLKKLIESHVRELAFDEENKHLILYVDNTAPLHELNSEEMDEHIKPSLEKIYDPDTTYEFRLYKERQMHEREKLVPHDIHFDKPAQ